MHGARTGRRRTAGWEISKKHKIMAKRQKKSTKRLTKNKISEMLQNLFLQNSDKTLSFKNIFKTLNLKTHPAKMLAVDVMEEMAWDDFLSKVSDNSYKLNTKGQVQEGRFIRKANGKNSFVPDDGGKPVFVAERNSLFALTGDRVKVTFMARRENHIKEAKVIEILERARDTFVGKLRVEKDLCLPRFEQRHICSRRHHTEEQAEGRKSNDKALVKVTKWPDTDNKNIIGEVVDILGETGDNDVEMNAILAQYGLPYRYPKKVEEAAEKISAEITEEDYKEREDFRDVTTFTIDPKDAKDFDDALSIRKLKEGLWEVGVHIADVTHYVQPRSVIDTEAEERGTSVYLVDRTIPMLPEKLSNELCSLRPDEESLCFSAVFTLNEEAEVLDKWFGRTVILSNRRFTYEEAQQIIETGKGDFAEEVLTLNRLAQRMRKTRFKRGAVSFQREEAKVQTRRRRQTAGRLFQGAKRRPTSSSKSSCCWPTSALPTLPA